LRLHEESTLDYNIVNHYTYQIQSELDQLL